MALDLSTKLSSKVTIRSYKEMLQKKDKIGIADFVFQRLTERYIVPMEHVPITYKNGFSIMANCCLLIETYQCFKEGENDTRGHGKGRRAFEHFFKKEVLFSEFKSLGGEFYDNVRCGILHQGETKKGWKITRKKDAPIFDDAELRINANIFLKTLCKVIEEYRDKLKTEDWTNISWKNCRQKIQHIINNCKST